MSIHKNEYGMFEVIIGGKMIARVNSEKAAIHIQEAEERKALTEIIRLGEEYKNERI